MRSPSGCETLRRRRRMKEPMVKENQDLLPSNGLEDSGYLSLQNSRLSDHYDNETDHMHKRDIPSPPPTTDNTSPPSSSPPRVSLSSSPPRVSLSSSPRVSLSSSPRASRRVGVRGTPPLPIVRFQQAVCAELARSFQKNHRYDWSTVSVLAQDHLLDRVIGGPMGRDHVDVFSALLSRNLHGILAHIIALLGDLDLISCRAVSQMWKKIILGDGAATGRMQRAMDNSVSQVGPGSGLTRDSRPRVVLSCMQTLASSSSRASSSRSSPAPSSNHTRFNTFLQAAGGLHQDEGLRCCMRCRSPARHRAQRATCLRSSCQFDFCTRCQEAFHGALPCRTLRPPRPPHARPGAPGGTRSKRSLRRL